MAIGQTSFFSGAVLVINATIGRKLDVDLAETGAFLLPLGKLGDLFGRKPLYTGAMTGFTIILVAVGFAPSAIYLNVFSGILGLFSTAVVPPASGGLGAVYKNPFSASNPLGFVGEILISGIASQVANWGASF
ncbi:hypothetical protein BBP40_011796 [Aspergillus hancockii]|nr:hypothetical protein BBP40_011796 [Aspergillus hancockii]